VKRLWIRWVLLSLWVDHGMTMVLTSCSELHGILRLMLTVQAGQLAGPD
jgi:hypothetical protein